MWPTAVTALMQAHPNMQTFEFRMTFEYAMTDTDTWTSNPPLPPVASDTEETWPPQDKVLDQIVVFWLDPETAVHEFWVFCGLNGSPEAGYMFHMGRYIVSKQHQTITCLKDIWFIDGNEWIEQQTLALDYVRRCQPWLKDYLLVQTCPQHQQAQWPDGEAILAAFTTNVRAYYYLYDEEY